MFGNSFPRPLLRVQNYAPRLQALFTVCVRISVTSVLSPVIQTRAVYTWLLRMKACDGLQTERS